VIGSDWGMVARYYETPTMRDRKLPYPLPTKLLEPIKLAAAYVRMSTEHQKYSTYNQLTALKEYAADHNLTITRVYADEGISGLQIKNRPGLKRLISDVVTGTASFGVVLVYDITRWGRFQDIDYSAFYEVACRMHGVDVVYCAEPFQDDHSPLSAILKTIRRAEAADFSRDLSRKVFNGQCNLARRGYSQGGVPRYGLKHIIVRDDGESIGRLTRRIKRLVGYHVEFAPGSRHEVRIVREIFRRYVKLGETILEIATYLNSKGYKTRFGRLWKTDYIANMLVEEKYIGTAVYNRSSEKLQTKHRRNDPSEWIRKPNAFAAIVDPLVFKQAQERRREELRKITDEEILARLRRYISRQGKVTQKAMQKLRSGSLHYRCVSRFGSLFNACELAGHSWTSKCPRWRERVRKRVQREQLLERLKQALEKTGLALRATPDGRFWVGERLCYFELAPRTTLRDGTGKWLNHCKYGPQFELYLLGRLTNDRTTVFDYYMFPHAAIPTIPVTLKTTNAARIDGYRATDLQGIAQRISVELAKVRPRYGVMVSQIAR
jgi:DNA invertase Pin-like site-specific DNA recombinase